MITPANHHSKEPYSWITTPHALISSLTQLKPHETLTYDFFLHHTEKTLDQHKTHFFIATISNQTYYTLCHTITIIAFGALGITASLITLVCSPHNLLTTLLLFAVIQYKFTPLFTTTLEERFFETAAEEQALKLILKKEKNLQTLTKTELDKKLKSLKINPIHYYKELYKIPSLKNHPDRERISSMILIYTLARFEYLQDSQNFSMDKLKIWEKELLTTRKKLKDDDKGIKPISFEERSQLEETAEKISAMIYELYEFDLPAEGHSSLLLDSIRAAYLFHLIKDPLHCPSYLNMGLALPKQSFEREALGDIPSAKSFFVTKNRSYIPKTTLVKDLKNISRIEKYLF